MGIKGGVSTRPFLLTGKDVGMQFHLLAFEGPDEYARAGGLASRTTGLVHALADAGFESHLWFVGDPDLPGHETHDQLRLHRWCQWLSRYHPMGVYDGEEDKQADYAASLPPFLLQEVLLPHLRRGGRAVILAEEWHTVHAVLHLDWLLRQAQVAPVRFDLAASWINRKMLELEMYARRVEEGGVARIERCERIIGLFD